LVDTYDDSTNLSQIGVDAAEGVVRGAEHGAAEGMTLLG
jgi:hypothetical protein